MIYTHTHPPTTTCTVSLRMAGTGSQSPTHNGRKELLPALHTFCFSSGWRPKVIKPHSTCLSTLHSPNTTRLHTHPVNLPSLFYRTPALHIIFEINSYIDALACCSTHGLPAGTLKAVRASSKISAPALFICAGIYRHKWSVSVRFVCTAPE